MKNNIRQLTRNEIPQVWGIDRTELIEKLYVLKEGKLLLSKQRFDMKGWPEGEAEHYTPVLLESFDRGAPFWGVFEHDRLVAAASVDPKKRGKNGSLLQLSFLHVSHPQRGQGLARILFDYCVEYAKENGADGLYISSTPSENSVNFYQHLGCRLIDIPDPELYEREPEDIHMVFYFIKPNNA
ncbi:MULTISPECIES: GNAT family N-acetyltransferase [Proteus]|uniref:Acetyltransferase (GNAT) family protein n=1 Tax=Proteus penneri TaxID=102862 RepID=A0A0G4QCR5_9GAMM|nr:MULTISPECIES: GNAT family N-acetyltransferase [Proteus]MCO8052457.1 GNAT family N-acetyltransferase [Proteus penneri]NBM58820.1 GNAT family N-acetyltransferase [Proteus sp. G2667]NBM91176.1 GNAT family N-acetyltransferase [Proteus sp. G2658]NBM93241.1 GNAT family N-acetyltransferase [Proteus sp. G2662]NBN24656.1 GNAT family N-acetyltransferase [Proteus sp. G2657]